MGAKETKAFTAANKSAWDASAHLHAKGDHWVELLESAARPGFSVLDDTLTKILTGLDVRGKRAAQVGCNNARELLSLASLGATPALGIDQSPAFLAQGAQLAKAAGLEPRLLEADIYDLPEGLGRYDLVLITIGVLSWMPDLPKFFSIVAKLLTDGGNLVIYETHPLLEMFDPDSSTPHEPAISYFDRGPHAVTGAITYDGKDHGSGETGYWFIHTLGHIVTSCVRADLRLVALEEYPHTIREPEYDLYEGRSAQIPMCFSLVAQR